MKLTRGNNRLGWNYKTKYFELKGQTLFFRKNESFKQGKIYNLTYRLPLSEVQSAMYLRSRQELILNVEMHEHCVILKMRKNPPGRTRSLQKWLSVFEEHGIPCVEED